MKVTYEIENGKKVKVKTYVDGSVFKYDENDNEIYKKDNSIGIEWWTEYDAIGRCIHRWDNGGYEEWREFDKKNNIIHFKDNYDEYWKEYDANGNVIHYKDNDGYEKWYEYDANENKIHFKDNEGKEKWY